MDSKVADAAAAAPAAAKGASQPPSIEFVGKFHSTLRWGKPVSELESLIAGAKVDGLDAVCAPDAKTGNQALHIAAQNGHRELVDWLLSKKSDVNAQNFKGQTPLHMSVEYDFYFISKRLLDEGASRELENSDGCKAILGISGSKEGAEAWDSPLTILKNASSKEELDLGLSSLEKADLAIFDKASLARAGMMKGKEFGAAWDKARFMEILSKA